MDESRKAKHLPLVALPPAGGEGLSQLTLKVEKELLQEVRKQCKKDKRPLRRIVEWGFREYLAHCALPTDKAPKEPT